MPDMLARDTAGEIRGWFAKAHKHCQRRERCDGPGCVRRTGKTERKRHSHTGRRTGHQRSQS